MRKFVSSIAAKSVTDAIGAAISSAMNPAFNAFKINLNPDEKIGLRTFAADREGYVRMVARIATQNPNALGRSDTPSELNGLLDYYNNLEGVRLQLVQALEIIQETQLGAAADSMTLTDRYVQNMQISRSNDASLDSAMQEVDDYNKRFGSRLSAADNTGGTGGNSQ
ncbi:MAG: hypothetical protein RL660_2218 [Bacteroidota bacterium]|jgi:hypothetical protein